MKNVLLTKYDKYKRRSGKGLLVFSLYCIGWHNVAFNELHYTCIQWDSSNICGESVHSEGHKRICLFEDVDVEPFPFFPFNSLKFTFRFPPTNIKEHNVILSEWSSSRAALKHFQDDC